MDRLLCGDVGYGKTEVALRAVMKCVLDGKQSAILVPTTVLAQQHYATAVNRFRDFPVKIEVLSRFTTAKEQKRILGALKAGGVDLLIGTHKLLQKNVEFKDLGLLIVDYLQLLATVNPGRTREQEVAECSRKLKGLARSLGCPVIVSSQLNRQAEDRAGSPELRHLRESGAIEQDADLVILLHRPERYHIRVDPDTGCSTKGMGIATLAKHRNGATGKVYYLSLIHI